jgi:hypothetical protein
LKETMHHNCLLALLACWVCAQGPATSFAEVRAFKITTDKTVDASSLASIVKDVIAHSGAKTNDAKAIALYEYLHNTIFHHAYPTEAAPQSVGPLKVINAYGWGLCGGQHTVLKALFEAAGWKCRYVGWPGHTTIEVFYDGKWHYFDVFLKCYYWTKDKRRVAGQADIAADPAIVRDAVKAGRAARQNLCCGDTAEGVIDGCKARKVVGDVKGWASVTWRDQGYSPLVNLPAGASLRLDWKAEPGGFVVPNKPEHTCGIKDFRADKVLGPRVEHYGPRNWSNGVFVYAPDFSRPGDVADIQLTGATAKNGKLVAAGKGVAVFKLGLPYPYVRARLDTVFEGGAGKVSLSTDAGKTWKVAPAGNLSKHVKQKYDLWIKLEFPGTLAKVRLNALVEHNRGALPYLAPGKNVVTVSADKNKLPKDRVLTVTYAYQEATVSHPERRTRFDGREVTYGKVKKVTKKVTSLPYTFEIHVKGNTPPRMISLERVVRGK